MTLPKLWLILWVSASFAMALLGGTSFYPFNFKLSQALLPPQLTHPFGFDSFGRDLFLLSLSASGFSIFFGVLSVFFSSVISLFLGICMALSPAPVRSLSQRGLEFLLAFPSLLLALTWSALHGPGWDTLIISLSLGTIPSFTRLIFVRTRDLLAENFVISSFALGSHRTEMTKNHLLPALFSICSIKIPGLFAHAILAEATLSYLGIGAPIGSNTWGSLLLQGKEYLLEAPHITLCIGLPLTLTVLSLQILSEMKTEKYLRL
jgi:ABC-type dipeptide/oligopeptide/nickel transport system permease subunit